MKFSEYYLSKASRLQIISPRSLLYLGPSIKVQGSEFAEIGLIHVDIQALTLIYVTPTVNSHVNQRPLLDLPHSPGIIWKYNILQEKKRMRVFNYGSISSYL